ncbi:hypothetical protein [Pseudonocardia sp.]|uniref:hypothetical protein n=1 Tax=Pseudonocardia sp. TaxID=60912 RepID=UPI003D0F3C9C
MAAEHATGNGPVTVPPLFSHLVDDPSLLRPRSSAPAVDTVVARYLRNRSGPRGELVGQLLCPVSRLPELVAALARAQPERPVDISLVVDTGLGAVPKALSTVFSRSAIVTPRTIETAAPPDVDAVWLERVSEFVPEDVVAVVEPRRPQEPDGTDAWLAAVRRVADHGCAPKLRCGGPRPSDVPSAAEVESFVLMMVETNSGFTARGLAQAVRPPATDASRPPHGIVNLLAAVARALSGGDVRGALDAADSATLVREVAALPEKAAHRVRGLLSRCGADPEPVPGTQLAGLGLL